MTTKTTGAKKPRTLADIKADPRVSYADKESGAGNDIESRFTYWIGLKDGWCFKDDPHNHTLHEDTLREVLARFDPVPCDCESCALSKAGA